MTSRLLGVVLTIALVVGCADRSSTPELVVGAEADPDSSVLAQLYAAALRTKGSPARVEHIPDPLAQLDTGAVSVAPGFTGQALQTFAPGTDDVIAAKDVYRAMVAALPEGVAAGDYATAAEDKPAVAVTKQTAGTWGGRDLTALPPQCAKLVTGSVTGATPPAAVGGCTLPRPREFATDAALFAALRAGQINAAWTSTADPDIPDDVIVLTDRQPAMVQAENVVALYRRNVLSEREVLALNEIAGEFDTRALADMRRQVAAGADPRQVAESWLAAHPLGG